MATMTMTLPSVPQMVSTRGGSPPSTRRRNSLGNESVCSNKSSATTTNKNKAQQRPSLMGRPGSRSMRNSRRQLMARNAMKKDSQKSLATEAQAPPTTRGVKANRSFGGSKSMRNMMSTNDTPQAPPTTRGVKANKSFSSSKSMRSVTNDTAQAPPSTRGITRGVKPNKTFGGSSTRSMKVEKTAPAPPSTRGVKPNQSFNSSKSLRNMSSSSDHAPPSTRGTSAPSRRGLQTSKSFNGASNSSSSMRSVVPGLPAIPAMATRSSSPSSVVLPPVPSMVSRSNCQSERNLLTAQRPRLGVMNKPVSRSMRSFGGKSQKSLRGSRRAKLTLNLQQGASQKSMASMRSMNSIKSRASQCSLLFHIEEDDDDMSKYAFSVCSEEKPHYNKNKNRSNAQEEDCKEQEDEEDENDLDALELEFGGELGEVDDDQECTVALTLDDDTVYMCSLRSIPQWIMMEKPEEKQVPKHHEGAIPKNGPNLNIPQEISIVFGDDEDDDDQAENATIITMDPQLRDFQEEKERDDDSVRVCQDMTSSFRIYPSRQQAQVQPVMPPPVQQPQQGYQNTRSSNVRRSSKETSTKNSQPQPAPMMNRRKSLMQSFGIKKIMFSWRKKDPTQQPAQVTPKRHRHHKMNPLCETSAHTQDTTATSVEDSELTFNTHSLTSF